MKYKERLSRGKKEENGREPRKGSGDGAPEPRAANARHVTFPTRQRGPLYFQGLAA